MKLQWMFLFIFLFQCQDIKRPPIYSLLLNTGGSGKLGVVTTDFGSNGRLSLVNSDLYYATTAPISIHSDAVARFQDNKAIIINRLNRDSIQILNPDLAYLTELEFSVGAGNNPHDYVKINDQKAYITLYNTTTLLIVNPTTGAAYGSVDLSSYAESLGSVYGKDNIPEMNYMYLEGGSLFVQLQRLDRNDISGYFTPKDTSLLLEIDVVTDHIIGNYPFKGRNPFSRMQKVFLNGEAYLVMAVPDHVGFISLNDGGVEAFHLSTRTFGAEYLYSEQIAGGDILEVQIKDETTGYAFVMDASLNKYIHVFNPSTGQKTSVLAFYPSQYGNFSGLLLGNDGKLFVSDASFTQPGISIYDTNNNNSPLTSVPIDTVLRPFDMFLSQ